MRRSSLALLACLLASAGAAKKKKSKGSRPSLPAELGPLCPFHRDEAEPRELSEFGHELERDGRQPEAVHCYARAIRSSPRAPIGWFDLATAFQYSEPSRALRYYRHGVSLEPSGFHPHVSSGCGTPPRETRRFR